MANFFSGDFYLSKQDVALTEYGDFIALRFGEFDEPHLTLFLSPEQIQDIGKQILSKVGLRHGA